MYTQGLQKYYWSLQANNSLSSCHWFIKGRNHPNCLCFKCIEYTNILRQPIKAKGALEFNEKPSRRRVDEGTALRCESFFEIFISGGRNAREREYPYQVALGYGNASRPDWRCGGTLISENKILTAAHCILTAYGTPKIVLLGDRRLSTRQDATRIERKVLEIYVHPEYKAPLQYNDIAIIKLESDVPFSRSVLPACLPDPADRLDRTLSVEVSGWGQTGAFDGPSDKLQSTFLKKIDTHDCASYFDSDGTNKQRLPNGILRSQWCAGDKTGLRDTCKGDSGGPATVTKHDENCVHYVVGITSFGSNYCGYQQPGVYTNTLSYLDWIENVVWYNNGEQGRSNLYTRIGVGDTLVLSPSRTKVASPDNVEPEVKDRVEDSSTKATFIENSTDTTTPPTTTLKLTAPPPTTLELTPPPMTTMELTAPPSTTLPATSPPSTTSSTLKANSPPQKLSILTTTTLKASTALSQIEDILGPLSTKLNETYNFDGMDIPNNFFNIVNNSLR
ncbi:Serine protease snake [Orchesella cincta]|uniref:Serine protease snake n=1 Tax=Orchesella cincta TaxID=48709 RepID=A0A1D2MCG4_ORCCI|nr:Serine protease snake [Orchesella cincta]